MLDRVMDQEKDSFIIPLADSLGQSFKMISPGMISKWMDDRKFIQCSPDPSGGPSCLVKQPITETDHLEIKTTLL